jgi:hypothetical protein
MEAHVMTFINEGLSDRVVRVVAGITLIYLAWLTWPASVMSPTGRFSLAFLVMGATGIVTGVVGWCPLYAAFNVSTATSTKKKIRP